MAQTRWAGEIDEVRVRQANELVDQMRLEMENLINENKAAKMENHSMKAEMKKYRVLIFVFSLATCVLVGKYLGFVRDMGQQARRLDEMETWVREIRINAEMENQTEFVWPIDGWAAKSRSARNGTNRWIFSEAFYSHRNGYKMCLSVWPHGRDTCKGTHLSVFFHLMWGPFDNILSWPFHRNVTLSLIDQHTGKDDVSDTVRFHDFPNNRNWNKPSTEIKKGFGILNLIRLTELSSSARLCRDDTLFIRCIVK